MAPVSRLVVAQMIAVGPWGHLERAQDLSLNRALAGPSSAREGRASFGGEDGGHGVPAIAVLAHAGKSFGGGLGELREVLAQEGITEPLWYEVTSVCPMK